MEYQNLKESQKIYFVGEKLPMELIARTENYGVVVRSLDFKEDSDLLKFEIERGCAMNFQEAFDTNKDSPVYSLLDFQEEKRAPSNLVFCNYDFWSKKDCVQAVQDLENGVHELSRRHGTDLNIDWDRTLNIK